MKNCIEKIRVKKRISRVELAKSLHMTYQNLFKIERNKAGITSDRLDDFCNILNCTVAEIFGQIDYTISENKKMIKVKFYEYMDKDYKIFETTDLKNMFLPEDFFRVLGIERYNNILCLKNSEKSMEPTISNGDFIIVNEDLKKIANNKIYLINENGTLKIKRIKQNNPFIDDVVIMSDNQIDGEYPPYTLKVAQAENIILGQVVFYGRIIL